MSEKKALLKLYYDCVSPYSWVAFESLVRYERVLNVDLELLPVSIGFIFKGTGNKPNMQQSEQKGRHMPNDLKLIGNYWGIPLNTPKDFVESLVKKATLNPQRFMTAVSIHSPEHLRPVSRELWMRAWSRDESVYGVEDIQQVCAKLQIPNSQHLIEVSNSDEVKALLKRRTDEAIAMGAFGLPWLVLNKRDGGKEIAIWGSDRLPMICDLLGKPYLGALKEKSEIDGNDLLKSQI